MLGDVVIKREAIRRWAYHGTRIDRCEECGEILEVGFFEDGFGGWVKLCFNCAVACEFIDFDQIEGEILDLMDMGIWGKEVRI